MFVFVFVCVYVCAHTHMFADRRFLCMYSIHNN
jgi:hypothetical protein